MTDLKQLTNTQFNTGYIYQKYFIDGMGTYDIPSQAWSGTSSYVAAPYTTITIPHNLGYVPVARVFYQQGVYVIPFPNPMSASNAGDTISNISGDYNSNLVFDSTNMYIRVFNNSGSTRSLTFFWRIYYGDS